VQLATATDRQQQAQAASAVQHSGAAAADAATIGATLLLEKHSVATARWVPRTAGRDATAQGWHGTAGGAKAEPRADALQKLCCMPQCFGLATEAGVCCCLPYFGLCRLQHSLLLLLSIEQLSGQDWSSYRLNHRPSSHTVRDNLAAALQAKDANASRHEVSRILLSAARCAAQAIPGSEPLVLKSSLPPAVDSPATQAAFAALFGTVLSQLPASSPGDFQAHMAYVLRGIWVQASDCGRLSQAAFDFAKDFGYELAVSQLHVQSAASSPAVAQLLLGSSALSESCLRWVLRLRHGLTPC
jgi:hypothetical protein